jgi:hypothetical protein
MPVMERRRALATAAAITAVVMAAGAASATNLGLLAQGKKPARQLGNLNLSSQPTEEVITVVVTVPAASTTSAPPVAPSTSDDEATPDSSDSTAPASSEPVKPVTPPAASHGDDKTHQGGDGSQEHAKPASTSPPATPVTTEVPKTQPTDVPVTRGDDGSEPHTDHHGTGHHETVPPIVSTTAPGGDD